MGKWQNKIAERKLSSASINRNKLMSKTIFGKAYREFYFYYFAR